MQCCQWLATTIEFNNPTEKISIYSLCTPFGVSCHDWCENPNIRLFCALVTRLSLQWSLCWRQAKCAPRVKLSLIPIHKEKLSYLILRMLVNGLNLLNATKLDQANYFARNTGTSGKSGQKWRPTCFDLKTMAPELTRRAFFGGHMGLELTWSTFFRGQVFFGQVWENSGKIPSHPQNFACSYTYDWKRGKTQSVKACIARKQVMIIQTCAYFARSLKTR